MDQASARVIWTEISWQCLSVSEGHGFLEKWRYDDSFGGPRCVQYRFWTAEPVDRNAVFQFLPFYGHSDVGVDSE